VRTHCHAYGFGNGNANDFRYADGYRHGYRLSIGHAHRVAYAPCGMGV